MAASRELTLQALLAEYQVLGGLYTTTCQITHARFTAFGALEGALLVGLFVLKSKATLLVASSCAMFVSLFFVFSTLRDYGYVKVRSQRGVALEGNINLLLDLDAADGNRLKTFEEANAAFGLGPNNSLTAKSMHILDFAIVVCAPFFWLAMIILLAKGVIQGE
ncbi:hypothetical protein N2152v2_006400 [Parachlorella kessleri]